MPFVRNMQLLVHFQNHLIQNQVLENIFFGQSSSRMELIAKWRSKLFLAKEF